MTNESSCGGAGSELPKSESLIPRSGQSVGAVGGDNAVGDDVRVAVERSLGVSVLRLVAGEVPDDQGLVTAAGQQHVGVLYGGSQTGDPAIVTLESALKNKLLGHCEGILESFAKYTLGCWRGGVVDVLRWMIE